MHAVGRPNIPHGLDYRSIEQNLILSRGFVRCFGGRESGHLLGHLALHEPYEVSVETEKITLAFFGPEL